MLEEKVQSLQIKLQRAEDDMAHSESELSTKEDVAALQSMSEENLEDLLKDPQTEFPEIPVRDSLKSINPHLTSVITQLRNVHKLSYSACLECFVCVGNGFFNQNYKLGQSAGKTRRARDIIQRCDRHLK